MDSPDARLVDFHSHFLPDFYVSAWKEAGVEHPDGNPGWPSWSVDDHLSLMDSCRVARAILSISSPGVFLGMNDRSRELAHEVNQYGARLVAQHPERLGHLASLPLPDVEGAVQEAVHALDQLDSTGILLMSNAAGVYLGDLDFERLWVELNRRSALVLIHPTANPNHGELALGRPAPMIEFIFDTTRTVSDLIFAGVFARYPRIRWVISHGGGTLPLLSDRMETFRARYAAQGLIPTQDDRTVSQLLRACWFDLAGKPFPNQVAALTRAVGDEHVVYGSDACWTPAEMVIAQVAAIDASERVDGLTWREVTARNAAVLLARDPT